MSVGGFEEVSVVGKVFPLWHYLVVEDRVFDVLLEWAGEGMCE